MSDHFGVRQSDLAAHAGTVAAIGNRVAAAALAGAAARAGGDAYGRLCVMVPIMLNALQDVLIGGIDEAADSLQDTGSRLRAAAQDYTGADERGRSALRGT